MKFSLKWLYLVALAPPMLLAYKVTPLFKLLRFQRCSSPMLTYGDMHQTKNDATNRIMNLGVRGSDGVTKWSLKCAQGEHEPSSHGEDSDEQAKDGGTLYSRQRFACRVMYDGSSFRGWQMQGPNQRTVQGIISQKLSQRFDMGVKITGAGRTDQGVHARGQAGHFDIPHDKADFDPDHLEYVVNRLLPDDVRMYNITKIHRSVDFHATGAAQGKLYSYRFCTNSFVDPTRRRYCAHFYMPFDMELFKDCLQMFVGSHDFRAFANRIEHTTKNLAEQGEGHTVDTIRTVHSVQLVDEGQGYYRVDFHLESALYRMVRNIVGSSLDVAAGNFSKDFLRHLLSTAPSRYENKAKSAPQKDLH